MGGSLEQTKFDGIYIETLDYYRAAFGMEPPSKLWEDPKIRFGNELLTFSHVCLQRIANYYVYEAMQPYYIVQYQDTRRRKTSIRYQ